MVIRMRDYAWIYEDGSPYGVFLYANRDTDKIKYLRKDLEEAGYRMWYDIGIEARIPWCPYMETHIKRSTVCVAVITEAFLSSSHLCRMLTCATLADIPIVLLFLEEISLTSGMLYLLADAEHLPLYRLPEGTKAAQVLATLSVLDRCRLPEKTEEEKLMMRAWEHYVEDKLSNAYEIARPLALKGYHDACNMLGSLACYKGYSLPRGEEGLYWWETSSRDGCAEADLALMLYHRNDYVRLRSRESREEQDAARESAEKMLFYGERASEKNMSLAFYHLGCYYLHIHQKEKALSYFARGARNGDDDAALKAYELYAERGSTLFDRDRAYEVLLRAAADGSSERMLMLAEALLDGTVFEKDETQAIYWLTLAADRGSKEGMYRLGIAYQNGEYVEQSYEMAQRYFRKAATGKLEKAAYALGEMYFFGQGVHPNGRRALEYYRQSHGYQKAYYRTACLYGRGYGLPMNVEKAIDFLETDCKREEPSPEALNALGYCYEKGYGVKKNREKAKSLYTRAAQSGFGPAYYNLGYGYEFAVWDCVDYEKAKYCYAKAIESCPLEAKEALLRLLTPFDDC
ncbi:MAG: toll/interleukin-1 receptor domain-containing protein [Clostridia bacterium]|nr:toll/interleukin-1 receptor domain-containing protein [Clostridia bacterium]